MNLLRYLIQVTVNFSFQSDKSIVCIPTMKPLPGQAPGYQAWLRFKVTPQGAGN